MIALTLREDFPFVVADCSQFPRPKHLPGAIEHEHVVPPVNIARDRDPGWPYRQLERCRQQQLRISVLRVTTSSILAGLPHGFLKVVGRELTPECGKGLRVAQIAGVV